MAQTLQHWQSLLTINSDNDTVDCNGTSKTLTAGDYYIAGYTSESTDQLVEHFQTKLREEDATANATYSYTTGKVTLEFSGTFSVTWTDSNAGVLLGFPANLSGAATYTSTNQCRHNWLPSRGLAEYPTNLQAAEFWTPRSNTQGFRSFDGTTFTVPGNMLYDALGLRYELLPEDEVKTPSTGTVHGDYQQFWTDSAHRGVKLRLYPDRTQTTATDYVEAIFASDDATIGSFDDYALRNIRSYNGLWDVNVPIWKYV